MERKFTKENFEAEVLKSELPVLVDFYADWCGPCRMMEPVVESLAERYEGKAVIGKIDSGENSDLALEYGVMSIPGLIIFKGGQVVYKKFGLTPEAELKAALDRVL